MENGSKKKNPAQTMKLSIKNFFSKCDQLKKSLMENFIFYAGSK